MNDTFWITDIFARQTEDMIRAGVHPKVAADIEAYNRRVMEELPDFLLE